MAAFERLAVPARENPLRRRQNLVHLGHAAHAMLVAGHGAFVRANELNAVRLELREIAPRGRVLPHAPVHGGRGQHRLVRRQQHGEVAREAQRHLREQAGGRGRDDDQIRLAGKPDVADLRLVLEVEQLREGGLSGKHRGGKRGYELPRGGGQDAANLGAALLRAPDEIQALVGRDAAADNKKDRLSLHGSSELGPPAIIAGPPPCVILHSAPAWPSDFR